MKYVKKPVVGAGWVSWALVGGIIAAGTSVGSVVAQGASEPAIAGVSVSSAGASSYASSGVETVLVTARRREERIQDVPLSITAISGDFVAEQNLTRIQEFAARIPNFNPDTSNPRTSSLSIRGVGGLGTGGDGSESGVGQIVDNVFYTHVGFGWAPLYDIESLEVARGPQGTLLGKNTTIGAVILRTRQPSFTPESGISISPRNYKGLQTNAYSTGPLTDRFAYRLSYFSDKDEGLVPNPAYPRVPDNQRDEKRLLDTNRWAARGQLLFQSLDGAVSNRVIFDHISSDEHNNYGGVIAPVLTEFSDGTPFPLYEDRIRNLYGIEDIDYDPRTGETTNSSKLPSYTNGLSNELNWQLGDYKITSVTAWRKFKLFPRNSQGYHGLYGQPSTGYDVLAEQYSQEIRLASPISPVLDWQVGAFWLKDDRDSNFRYIWGKDAAVFQTQNPNANPAILDGVEHDSFGKAHTRSYALFGQGTWHLSSAFDLTAGLRVTHEKRSGSVAGYSFGGAQDLSPEDQRERERLLFQIRTGDFFVEGDESDTSVSWLINPSWRITPDLLVYASVAQGSKSGAINTDARPIYTTNNPETAVYIEDLPVVIRPEKATDFELGFKKSWPEYGASLAVNLYQNDLKDYQASLTQNFIDPATGTELVRPLLGNIEHVRLRGVELESHWSPSRSFTLYLNAALSEAQYVKYENAANPAGRRVQRDNGSWATPSSVDLSGTDIPNVPEWTANIGFDWNHPFGTFHGGDVELFLYTSHALKGYTPYSTAAHVNAFGQDTYGLTNAGIGLRRDDGSFSLSLWAKNLFDEDYYDRITQNSAAAPALARLGQPRTLGVTLSLKIL